MAPTNKGLFSFLSRKRTKESSKNDVSTKKIKSTKENTFNNNENTSKKAPNIDLGNGWSSSEDDEVQIVEPPLLVNKKKKRLEPSQLTAVPVDSIVKNATF